MDVRAAIADERRRTADLIESLDPAQLQVPSLCGEWTVKQVAAHLLAAVDASPGATVRALLRGGLRLHRANALLAVEIAARPAAELAAALRANATNSFRPPIVGYPGQLTDLHVHGQDMRRPLGLPHGLDLDRLRVSLDFLTGGRAVGFTPRRRLAGLRFEATDLHWSFPSSAGAFAGPSATADPSASAGVSGALVAGPAEALMMAMAGRPAALSDLDGPGVRLLAGRLH